VADLEDEDEKLPRLDGVDDPIVAYLRAIKGSGTAKLLRPSLVYGSAAKASIAGAIRAYTDLGSFLNWAFGGRRQFYLKRQGSTTLETRVGLELSPRNGALSFRFPKGRFRFAHVEQAFEPLQAPHVLQRHYGGDVLAASGQHEALLGEGGAVSVPIKDTPR
jgi:hypothetical protein